MSIHPAESGDPDQSAPITTTIFLVGGERLSVEGGTKDVEAMIIAAARGSIMQLAWVTEAGTGEPVAINPEHVLMLRKVAPESSL